MVNYPQSGPTSFSGLLAPLPKDIREVATRLRSIVKTVIPEADEAVSGGAKMGMALYSIEGANNVICGIQPTEDMCKLYFHGWEHLKTAGYRLEGSGKNARHIKIRSSKELEPAAITAMINIAAGDRLQC